MKIRWLTSIFLLIIILFSAGCNNDNDEKIDPLAFYKQVELGMLKDDLEATLGVEAKEKDGSYLYIDSQSDFGVMIAYDASKAVAMKTLYHDDEKKIMDLGAAEVNESQVEAIKEGMSYEEVRALLGSDGMEIVQVNNPANPNKPIHAMIWFNPDHTGIYTSFLGEKGSVINSFYYNQ